MSDCDTIFDGLDQAKLRKLYDGLASTACSMCGLDPCETPDACASLAAQEAFDDPEQPGMDPAD